MSDSIILMKGLHLVHRIVIRITHPLVPFHWHHRHPKAVSLQISKCRLPARATFFRFCRKKKNTCHCLNWLSQHIKFARTSSSMRHAAADYAYETETLHSIGRVYVYLRMIMIIFPFKNRMYSSENTIMHWDITFAQSQSHWVWDVYICCVYENDLCVWCRWLFLSMCYTRHGHNPPFHELRVMRFQMKSRQNWLSTCPQPS